MARLQMVFEGEEAKLVQSFIKINQQYDKMKGKARETNRETKRGTSVFQEFGSQVGSQLASMAVGMVGVQAGIQAASQMWTDWQAQIEDTGRALTDFTNELKAATTGRGDPYGQIRPEIIEIANRQGLTREEAIGLYEGVGGAFPLAKDPGVLIRTMATAAQAKQVGMDPSLMGAAMGIIGRFAMPGADPRDVANAALASFQALGAEGAGIATPRFGRGLAMLQGAGIQGPEALQMLVGAQFAGERPTFFQQILGQAALAAEKPEQFLLPAPQMGEAEDPSRRKRRLLRQRYSQMSPDDFVRNVLADPDAQTEFIGPGNLYRFRAVSEGISKVGPAIEMAVQDDLLRRTWDDLSQHDEVVRAWEQQFWEARKDLAPLLGGTAAERREAQRLWLTKEDARLEGQVQRGEITRTEKGIMMKGLRVGLAGGFAAGFDDPAETEDAVLSRQVEEENKREIMALVGMGQFAAAQALRERLAENTAGATSEVERL